MHLFYRNLLQTFTFFLFLFFPFLNFAQVPQPLTPPPAPTPGQPPYTSPSVPPAAPLPVQPPLPPTVPSTAPVLAPQAPAPIAIPPSPSGTGQPKTDLLIVLDVSGSMNSLLEGQRMIDWAKRAISQAMALLPPDAEVGLRVYAHRVERTNKEASCKDTELLVPIGRGNATTVSSLAQTLQPKGWTPIAYSLEQAANDFAGHTEKLHTIILVSDGEETCGGNPLAAARSLTQRGYRVVINTIGFNVDEAARNQLTKEAIFHYTSGFR